MELKESCLKQYKPSFTSRNVVNVFIVYKLDVWSRDLNAGFTLNDCLLETVKLTKNAEQNKYSYSGYSVGFASHSRSLISKTLGVKMLLFLEKTIGHQCILITSKKIILVLGEGLTQRLDDTSITAEAKYSINFTES